MSGSQVQCSHRDRSELTEGVCHATSLYHYLCGLPSFGVDLERSNVCPKYESGNRSRIIVGLWWAKMWRWGPGTFRVEPSEGWIKLIPADEGPASAILVEATAGEHEESLTEFSVRLEFDTENPEVFHHAMLYPDGTGIEAKGAIRGIRPRGFQTMFRSKIGLKERKIYLEGKMVEHGE